MQASLFEPQIFPDFCDKAFAKLFTGSMHGQLALALATTDGHVTAAAFVCLKSANCYINWFYRSPAEDCVGL
jgi:hypothetical protein